MFPQSIYTAFSVVGNIFTIVLVGRQGKRSLVLWTTAVCSLSYMFIGMIGLFHVETELAYWTKTALFFASTFSSSLGIMPLGWIFMGEVFPMKYVRIQVHSGRHGPRTLRSAILLPLAEFQGKSLKVVVGKF